MATLFASPRELAQVIYTAQSERDAEVQRYSADQTEKCLRDIEYTLDFLNQAWQVNSPQLFLDYIQWLEIVLRQRGLATESLHLHLETMADVLRPIPEAVQALPYLAAVLDQWDALIHSQPASKMTAANPLHHEANLYLGHVLGMRRGEALKLVQDLVARNIPVREIYLHLFQPVQQELGRLWQINQISVAQEHYATAVTQLAMSQLYPYIFASERSGFGLVAACVGNELHEIGIRMVADFFEMAGWDTYYLGANTPAESIIRTVNEQNADVVALSVTLSSHISRTKELVTAIKGQVDDRVKILVGGYPFNVDPQAWTQVGADGSALNAESAIDLAYSLVSA
ncbi:MAG: cobalamin B12-binding domain-containing protein [Anaerolineae bacterium]|nr:cobalamin B12-binding domain-containing protein [Anaerolineae bacterium]